MAWSEIKKAVNDNIDIPLNKVVGEKILNGEKVYAEHELHSTSRGIQTLDEIYPEPSTLQGNAKAVKYNGNYYIIITNTISSLFTSIIYRFNNVLKQYEAMCSIPITADSVNGVDAFVYDDLLHIFTMRSRSSNLYIEHYIYDDKTNVCRREHQYSTNLSSTSSLVGAVILNDGYVYVYVQTFNSSNNDASYYHFLLGSSSMGTMANIHSNLQYLARPVLLYHNKIHIFGVVGYSSSLQTLYHYEFDGTNYVQKSDISQIRVGYFRPFIFNDTMYYIAAYDKKMYKWDEDSDTWSEVDGYSQSLGTYSSTSSFASKVAHNVDDDTIQMFYASSDQPKTTYFNGETFADEYSIKTLDANTSYVKLNDAIMPMNSNPCIKSIQKGFSKNGNNNEIPISPVNPSKCLVLYDYASFQSSTNYAVWTYYLYPTTLRFITSSNTEFNWTIIEFY